MNTTVREIDVQGLRPASKEVFKKCPVCGATNEEQPGSIEQWITGYLESNRYRWTRCGTCNSMARQKYNTFLHQFLEPDYLWDI